MMDLFDETIETSWLDEMLSDAEKTQQASAHEAA